MVVRSKSMVRCFLLAACVLSLTGGAALAQYAGPAVTSPPRVASAPPSTMHAGTEEIKIMPDDVIAIATLGAPELTTSVLSPTASIAPTVDDPQAASVNQLFINPDECIDCGSCANTCPQHAIYAQEDLPADKQHFAEKNQAYFN